MPLSTRLSRAYGLEEARGYGRTPWLLTLGTLLLGTGRGLVGPYTVLFLVAERGLPLPVVGLGITLEFLLRAAAGPVAGGLSDRIGRKPLMATGLLATALLLPSYLLVETPLQFYAISVANGLLAAHSLYGPAANALVADLMPPRQRGAVFGLLHASRNLGFTLGIGAGLLLIDGSYAPVFAAAALLPLLFLVTLLPLVHAPPPPGASTRPPMTADWSRLLRTAPFVAFLLLSPVFYLGWGQVNTIFPLFLTDGLGLQGAAISIIGINSAMIVLLQVPFGRLADRAPRGTLLAAAALALGASYLTYAAATRVPGLPLVVGALVGGIVLFTVAEMLYSPVLSAYAADLAPAGTLGSALGLVAFAQAVGIGAPPLLADLLLPLGGWALVWVAMALVCVPSALGLFWLGRRTSG